MGHGRRRLKRQRCRGGSVATSKNETLQREGRMEERGMERGGGFESKDRFYIYIVYTQPTGPTM